MNKPAAYPEPMEPLADLLIATKSGTSHTVKVVVNRAAATVKLSDGSLHIKNGDAVIWDPTGIDSSDKLVIRFAGTILRSSHIGAAGRPVSVDVTEEVVVGETPKEPYSLVLLDKDGKEIPLTYDGLTSRFADAEPTLVVDDMGKPPGMGGGGGGGEDHHHGRRSR